MADPVNVLKVFVSYSQQPQENVEFVRALVQRLNSANSDGVKFDAWLDEERIAAAEDIQDTLRQAISKADAAIFVVNTRWTDRERTYIRHEVSLLGARREARLVVLLREALDTEVLDHTFTTLKRLDWYPGEPDPDACFWEVVCGITGTLPGPRSLWSGKGKQISGGARTIEPESAPVKVLQRGKPVRCFSADNLTYLVSEEGEWAAINGQHPPQTLLHPPCRFALATVDSGSGLLLAGYDGTLARYNGRNWRVLSHETPVLCFASTLDGTLAGMVSGHIVRIESDGIRQVFQMRDPVASLAGYDDGVLVIGSQGIFGRLELPAPPGAAMEWISTGDLGRPVEFFQAVESSQVGLQSSTRVAVLEPRSGRLTTCSWVFEGGVRSVTFLGAQSWPYAVLTDDGMLTMVDAAMGGTKSVHFPRGTVVRHCASAIQHGGVLAWTQDGSLYIVFPHGSVEQITADGVVLAYESPQGGIDIVRYNQKDGTTVQSVRLN